MSVSSPSDRPSMSSSHRVSSKLPPWHGLELPGICASIHLTYLDAWHSIRRKAQLFEWIEKTWLNHIKPIETWDFLRNVHDTSSCCAARYALLFSVEMFIRICAVGPLSYFWSSGFGGGGYGWWLRASKKKTGDRIDAAWIYWDVSAMWSGMQAFFFGIEQCLVILQSK